MLNYYKLKRNPMVQTFKKKVKLDAYKYAYIFVIFILLTSCFSDAHAQSYSYQNSLSAKEQLKTMFAKINREMIPTYLLSSKYASNGFKVEAKCIDEAYKANIENINASLTFRWGIKLPNKSIRWIDTNSSSVFIPIEDKDAVIFLKIIDSNGKESPLQSVKCTATDIFYASNNRLLLDTDKKVYKEDGTMYSYKYGKIYLTRDTSLPKEYQGAIWTSTKAKVYSPFSNTYVIPVSGGEMSIKNIIPQEELDYITHNTQVGHTCLYTIALLNPEYKFIQIIPVTIKIK